MDIGIETAYLGKILFWSGLIVIVIGEGLLIIKGCSKIIKLFPNMGDFWADMKNYKSDDTENK